MHRLDVEKKRYIRTRIIAGAINYKLLLVNKKFLIICEDGTYREVCFMIKDYQHLTGVKIAHLFSNHKKIDKRYVKVLK